MEICLVRQASGVSLTKNDALLEKEIKIYVVRHMQWYFWLISFLSRYEEMG